MTYQRDPERPITTPLTTEEIARREDNALREAEIARHNNGAVGSSGIMPIVLTLLVLLGVGYFAYTLLSPRGLPDTPRTTEHSAPRDVTPLPAPAPPPATTPNTK